MPSVQGYGLKSEQHREAGWVYPGSGGTHDSRQGSLAPGASLHSDDAPDAGESTLPQLTPSIQHANHWAWTVLAKYSGFKAEDAPHMDAFCGSSLKLKSSPDFHAYTGSHQCLLLAIDNYEGSRDVSHQTICSSRTVH